MIQERYLSPDGRYAVEVVVDEGPFFREVRVGPASSKTRQSLGEFDLPVQGSPSFFEDNSILVIHTGSMSSGVWPIVYLRTTEGTFEEVHEFSGADLREVIRALKKLPDGHGIIHLYTEVTGFRAPKTLELSLSGDGELEGRRWVFEPFALDYSLPTKSFLDTGRQPTSRGLVPRMAFMELAGYGTGFFVQKEGWLLTCHHVVNGMDRINVLISTGETQSAAIAEFDEEHDVALLRIRRDAPATVPLLVDGNIAQGDEVYTLGFPLPNLQGFNPKLTSGIVSALTGLMDDPDVLQITTAIQPGNSGGAVVSDRGSLVGIASSTIKPETFFATSGSLPQNVNYAIGLRPIRSLLTRWDLHPVTGNFDSKKASISNLTKSTVQILVYRLPHAKRLDAPSEG